MGKTSRLSAPARLTAALVGSAAVIGSLAWPLLAVAQVAPVTKAAPLAAPLTPAPTATQPRAPARPTVGCLIGPEAVVDIGSPVTALVTQVAVDRGDSVRAGQTLVQLESEVERNSLEAARSRAAMDADVLAAEAQVALARQRHTRAVELVRQGFTSPQTLEQARAEFDVAQQKLSQARSQKSINAHELGLVKAQLNQRTIKSPFNGVVVDRFVSPGERAEDKPLLRVAMLNPLRVELVLPATRWGSLSAGDAMPIVPELPAATPVVAKVTHIDKMIDAASNTFRVRLSLPNPGNQLPAGARCRVEGLDASSSAAVPAVPSARAVPAEPSAAPRPASLQQPKAIERPAANAALPRI
jgi:membrane fusion protein, heavy metal efflux system